MGDNLEIGEKKGNIERKEDYLTREEITYARTVIN